MKNIIIAATITLLSTTGAFAARVPDCNKAIQNCCNKAIQNCCNKAIQNWQYGSKTTCVYDIGRGGKPMQGTPTAQFTPAPPPANTLNLNDQLR